jgi:Lipid A 3-O-deacylase (PagL)
MHKRLGLGLYIFCLGCIFMMPPFALGNEREDGNHNGTERHPFAFREDGKSLQFIAGVFTSPVLTVLFPKTQDFEYAQVNVRIGWMLNAPQDEPSILRGNYEALFELTNSAVLKGSGNYIGGFNLLLRYNFVQPGAWMVPYIQGSAGIVYNDVYKDGNQLAIGEAVEFMLGLAGGLHFFVRSNWSIDMEVAYQHISNAGLAHRNDGNNAAGAFLGFTCHF